MKDYVCEPLGNQHDRTQFDGGVSVLIDYVAKYAKQVVKRNASAVFVLLDRAEPKRGIGFYTLSDVVTNLPLFSLQEHVSDSVVVAKKTRDIDAL